MRLRANDVMTLVLVSVAASIDLQIAVWTAPGRSGRKASREGLTSVRARIRALNLMEKGREKEKEKETTKVG